MSQTDLIQTDRFELSQAEYDAIEHEMHHYEDPRAASIEALKIVQKQRGWVPDYVMVRRQKDLHPATAEELAADEEIRKLYLGETFKLERWKARAVQG